MTSPIRLVIPLIAIIGLNLLRLDLVDSSKHSKINSDDEQPANGAILPFPVHIKSHGSDKKVLFAIPKTAPFRRHGNATIHRRRNQDHFVDVEEEGELEGYSKHDDCVSAHNQYRSMHNAGPLQTDEKVLKWARMRAKEIVHRFAHTANSPYGENLAWISVKNYPCSKLVEMWYDEIQYYDFSAGEFSHETGHFTQLVWRGTTHVGCGYYSTSKGTFLSCGYQPPGNLIGDFQNNVHPKTG